MIPPAPFFIASLINLFPSFFFPLNATNKLFFFKVLESIERPFIFRNFCLPKILFKIISFCK